MTLSSPPIRQAEAFCRITEGNTTVINIMMTVCGYFGVTPRDLAGARRKPGIVLARHLAMYFLRKSTRLTLKQIGKIFNRGHDTVIHAFRSVDAYPAESDWAQHRDALSLILNH
jgi:chromosomal replication initiation ATPase DnaA